MTNQQGSQSPVYLAKRLLRQILSRMTHLSWLRWLVGSVTRRIPALHEKLVRVATGTDTIADRKKSPARSAPRNAVEARLTMDARRVYRQLCELLPAVERASTRKSTAPQGPPRLAYVSPLPPVRSGISDYSSELIPALASHYEIELVVDQPEVSDQWLRENFAVRSIEWFRNNAEHYDRVLYHVGNAPYHRHVLECLEVHPGVVVLHDFFLGDLHAYREFEAGEADALSEELYLSHGYDALKMRCDGRIPDAITDYPSNFSVLRDASGVIVHSAYSRKLAERWYGAGFSNDWACIPHLRVPQSGIDRDEARGRLGFDDDAFVICSFGVLGRSKQNHRLFDTWRRSALGSDPRCILVFVGGEGDKDYSRELQQSIASHGLGGRVRITGWADKKTFQDHLAAADAAVQLRAYSRGETSGTVLDCMNHAVPTIVNACGPMADLPADAVWMLPKDFDDAELIQAMETLRDDKQRRHALAERARAVILEQHDPAVCAGMYTDAIERFHEAARRDRSRLLNELIALSSLPASDDELAALATDISRNSPARAPASTLFIDVSVTSRTKLRTGIERVTRALLHEFMKSVPDGYRVEPVYLSDQGGHWHYRYARHYMLDMLSCPTDVLRDERIEPRAGDFLFCADLAADMVVAADRDSVYRRLREAGVSVSFMVHDLLPMSMPEVFPPSAREPFVAWLRTVVRVSDIIVCVSRAVKSELEDWIAQDSVEVNPELRVEWSHHGSDLRASGPDRQLPHDAKRVPEQLRKRRTFLCVGTLEPRKGYAQVLDAFERLWRENDDLNLVIVGKEGWQGLPDEDRRDIPDVVRRLKKHPERNRRLFWLEDVSDEYLEQLYENSDCLLAASLGEGFGLPLIEASRHGIPLLLRDIPVFREVAGAQADFFRGNDPLSLAEAIRQWLEGHAGRKQDSGGALASLSWRQSARKLMSLLLPQSKVHVERKPCLYVDVSVVSRDDFRTGIQRVVRALYREIAHQPPEGFSVHPVRLVERGGRWRYAFATGFRDKHGAVDEGEGPSGDIAAMPGDVLLGLDLAGSMVVDAAKQGVYRALREDGATTWFVVYDLLPVTAPHCFSRADSEMHEMWLRAISEADGVACISATVAKAYQAWHLKTFGEHRSVPKVRRFPLGSDIERSAPSRGLPRDAHAVLAALSSRPTFLAVGTVEPRKCYDQVLHAFRRLWATDIDVNFVIVGKQGWNVEALSRELSGDPESGRRLFWLEGISDEYLERIYAASSCLVAASADEGFGLPLVEAARHGLPLLVRDIPVFKEVAGEGAFYFNGHAPADLESAIRAWLVLDARGEAPRSQGLGRRSWQESANELIDRVLGGSRENDLKQTDGS